jgi:integrase
MSGLDRSELGVFLVQAGLSGVRDHTLACLLALNGLRVSEAIGTDVDDLDLERGHHTLRIVRRGGSTVIVPFAPRSARTVHPARAMVSLPITFVVPIQSLVQMLPRGPPLDAQLVCGDVYALRRRGRSRDGFGAPSANPGREISCGCDTSRLFL